MFPVKKNIVRISQLSFLIALITFSPGASFAQSNIGQNTIVEIREDRAKTSAALLTSSKKQLPRPIIQFLQGENGNTVLVADFSDVVFPFSTRVINVNATPIASHATIGSAERSGIKLVRIGKFQESPPVCRVAIVSSDPDKLRAVTFDSRPGSLLIKWPKASTIVANGYGMPPQAPSFRGRSAPQSRRGAYESTFNPPPVFPPTGEIDPAFSEIPQDSQSRIDPEIASSGLRGAIPAPENPQNNSRQYINPAYAKRGPDQGLAADAQSLRTASSKGNSSMTSSAKWAPTWQGAAPEGAKTASKWGAKPSSQSAATASASEEPQPNAKWNAKSGSSTSKQNAALPKLAKEDASVPKVAPDRFSASKNKNKIAQAVQKKPVGNEETNLQQSPQDQAQGERTDVVSNIFSKVKEKTKRWLGPENQDQQTEEIQVLKNDSKKSLDVVTHNDSAKATGNNDDTDQLNDSKNGVDGQASTDNEPAPQVFLTQNNSGSGYSFKIVSPDKRDLNFSSFRLHNPERFVIDLEGLRGVQTIEVPQPENTEMLKAIRVGAPDPLKNTGRLVLDLSGEAVSVIPGDTASVNEVSFVIGESSNPLVGLSSPPGSVIVVDAGHGGTDPGAQRGYVKEKDLTLAIAKKTREKLEENGVKVVMTRGDDTFIPLPERVNITNNLKPDLFLSVHINSLESSNDIHGIETYYQTDISKPLAQQVHDSLVTELTAPNRAIRKAKFYVINRTEVPAVLAEVGFISNKAERDKLVSEDYQEKIAGALAKGAILYLKQHSSVASKISRTSEQSSEIAPPKHVGGTIPRASELVHKGLGIKSH